MPLPSEIIRCLLKDGFNPSNAISYCERIAATCRYLPDSGEDCHNYSEAARRLRETAAAAPPHPQASLIRGMAQERAAAAASLDAQFNIP